MYLILRLKNATISILEYLLAHTKYIIVGGTTLFLSLRLFRFVDGYSVNLLYWDQWDFLTPLFEGRDDIWTLFTWQHGPHRQGIGFFIIKLVALATNWNTRADAFSIAITIVIACILALLLKYRLFSSLGYSDIVIPIIVLNLNQYETLLGNNISLAALPLALLMLYCISWTINNRIIRYVFVVTINTLMLFTGFGLIIFPITLFLIGLDIYRAWREGNQTDIRISILSIVIIFLSLLLFLFDYRLDSGVHCFRLSRSFLLQYPTFMSLMFAKYPRLDLVSVTSIAKYGGAILIALLVIVFLFHLNKIIRGKMPQGSTASFVILALVGFSLLFSASTAVGRTCLGLKFAMSSRYMTLLIPAFIGLYFHLLSIINVRLRTIAVVFMILAITASFLPFSARDSRNIDYMSAKKENWKQCYLTNSDWSYCDKNTKFRVYPSVDERIQKRMKYLEDHQLNLFIDAEHE